MAVTWKKCETVKVIWILSKWFRLLHDRARGISFCRMQNTKMGSLQLYRREQWVTKRSKRKTAEQSPHTHIHTGVCLSWPLLWGEVLWGTITFPGRRHLTYFLKALHRVYLTSISSLVFFPPILQVCFRNVQTIQVKSATDGASLCYSPIPLRGEITSRPECSR